MRHIRDLLTFAAFWLLSGVSLAGAMVAAGQIWRDKAQKLPATDGWQALVGQDLATADRATQRGVLTALESAWDAGAEWQGRWRQLADDDRQRAAANLQAIAPLWLADEAERYFGRPPSSRDDYLDARIDRLQRLVAAVQAVAGDAGQPGLFGESTSLLTQAPLLLNQWLESIEPERREQTQNFVQAAMLRFLTRPYE